MGSNKYTEKDGLTTTYLEIIGEKNVISIKGPIVYVRINFDMPHVIFWLLQIFFKFSSYQALTYTNKNAYFRHFIVIAINVKHWLIIPFLVFKCMDYNGFWFLPSTYKGKAINDILHAFFSSMQVLKKAELFQNYNMLPLQNTLLTIQNCSEGVI